jgi:ABC-type proline/glycine betaine transport system permease subunit/CheY-like chemotaxis protein
MSYATPIVFVVDDDVSVRESLESLIRCEGWRPEAFPSAAEFLARPRDVTPSCLVLDLTLPGMNGLELQERIAGDRSDMPIIFISGYGDVPKTVRAMKAGAVEFLTKPLNNDELLRAIRQAIERIFCQRFRRTGRAVLAVVGLLQTIPSLALLVLLMPVVGALGYPSIGEGSVTAVVALLAYCLFPIVRNTFTGLEGIPRGTIESATVLGLSPAAKLAEIELPMALPVMLAGLRTAAVQNVGFATLGAIIGAGGLGQPILRGFRLNDVRLILAGAIPAALLALLLQLLIDWVERVIVPRGMRGT